MKIESAGKTNIGLKRDNNQDTIYCDKDLDLYMVADGMGGHKGGKIASKMAISLLRKYISNTKKVPAVHRIKSVLKNIISNISKDVYEMGKSTLELENMGTTLVAVLVKAHKSYLMQVGDSRIYLYRKPNLWQITEDHSLVNEQLNSGIITQEEANKASYKNVITRSIGVTRTVDADIYEREIQKGDLFLLCSDGLTSMISDEDITKTLNDMVDLEDGVNNLIEKANEAGGDDNISIVLIEARG